MTTFQDTTGTLFAEPAIESQGTGSRALKIAAEKRQKLTPSQQTFNRLSKRIEQLQRGIQEDKARYEALLQAYSAAIPALQRSVALAKIALAKALADTTKMKMKYGKRQAEDVRITILMLCDEAFAAVEADEDTQRFYDECADTSYAEELENQKTAMMETLADTAKAVFGVDIDFSDMGDTPEDFARFAKRIESEMMGDENRENRRAAGRKKTQKQLEKEDRDRQREQQQLKSIRGLYLSLAKALHPDTETDPTIKGQKDELMRKVTAAYAAKDLAALLKLELEWVAGESDHLASLPDEKLKLYIVSLKEQVAALESERAAVAFDPRFSPIQRFATLPPDLVKTAMHQWEKSLTYDHRDLLHITTACSDAARKKEIVEFVKDYVASNRYISMSPDDDFIIIR